MAITQKELSDYLNQFLNIKAYEDYCPNGLQIEGSKEISKIAYAVSCTQDSVAKAVALGAHALIVHHGLFWKFHGVRTITDAFAKRVKPLIQNEINLYGYHLPLDGHMVVGNAASIAKRLSLKDVTPFGDHKGMATGVSGELPKPLSVNELRNSLQTILNHNIILTTPDEKASIKTIGIITGGANSEWKLAQKAGLDAYLTGEMSEHDWHEAKEGGVHFFAGGHNATEQFGIQELLKHISEKFQDKELEHFFIPSSNPA